MRSNVEHELKGRKKFIIFNTEKIGTEQQVRQGEGMHKKEKKKLVV